jgi:hypothetical protein
MTPVRSTRSLERTPLCMKRRGPAATGRFQIIAESSRPSTSAIGRKYPPPSLARLHQTHHNGP